MNLARARSTGAGDVELLPFIALTGGVGENHSSGEVIDGFGINAGLASRFGVAEWFDIGFMASFEQTFYLRLDTKLTAVDTEDFALALDPGVASHVFAATAGEPVIELRAPVLMDIELGHDVALVLGPSYTAILYTDKGAPAWEHWLGMSVGVDIPLGKNVRVLPELSVPIPIDSRWDAIAVTLAVASIMEL
jgi:hypothetical protein